MIGIGDTTQSAVLHEVRSMLIRLHLMRLASCMVLLIAKPGMIPYLTVNKLLRRTGLVCAVVLWLGLAVCAQGFNYAPLTEKDGSFVSVAGNPADVIYELNLGVNRHFLYTPLYSSYFLLGSYNDLQGSTYVGAGASLRLMPWPNFTPFLGCGLAFDYAVYDQTDPNPWDLRPHTEWFLEVRTEAGLRYSPHENEMFYEFFGQYRYSANADDGAYWLVGVTIGIYLDTTGIGIKSGDSYGINRTGYYR